MALLVGVGSRDARADDIMSSFGIQQQPQVEQVDQPPQQQPDPRQVFALDAPSISDADDSAPVIIENDKGMGERMVPDTPEKGRFDSIENGATAAAETKKPMSRRGRIKELEDIKAELAKKELELLSKENALLEKEQSISVLRQELEIERKLRALITKEKEEAEEESLLSKSLCTGSTMLP